MYSVEGALAMTGQSAQMIRQDRRHDHSHA